MSGAYVAKAAAAPDVCGSGPAGWNPFWLFPGPPWAPGWPIGIPSGYSLNLTLGTVTVGAAVNLISKVLFSGLDDSNLQCHALQVTALINGVTLNLSDDNVTFTPSLIKSVRNYSGSSYGFNKNLYLNLNSGNIGQSGSITVTNISTNPTFSATVNFTVADVVNLVAVGAGATHYVMTSADAITWTMRTAAENNNWNSVCWAPSLGLYVAVADSGTHRAMTSPDGITWTPQTAVETNGWQHVCWSPELSLLVAVSSFFITDGAHQIMTSPDGVNWTGRIAPAASSWANVSWSSSLSLFVAVSDTGAGAFQAMYSSNGTSWTGMTKPVLGNHALAWSGDLGLFVAAVYAGTGIATSTIGTSSWISRTGAANGINGLVWSHEKLKFVGVSVQTGAQKVSTSPDGISWTAQTPATNDSWFDVTWSPSIGLFIAVAASSVSTCVMTSPDGVTWTSRTAEANGWRSVCAKS